MTKRLAKLLSLEVWRYLRDCPEIDNKDQLPSKLYAKIKSLKARCPLCKVFNTCAECPLQNCFRDSDSVSDYYLWYRSTTSESRAQAAANIVKKIEDWEV